MIQFFATLMMGLTISTSAHATPSNGVLSPFDYEALEQALFPEIFANKSVHPSENTGAPGAFDFYTMEETFYRKAFVPNESDLLGTWVWVGFAKLAGYPGAKMPVDAYDPNGIKNRDGSLHKLVFSTQEGFVGGKYLAASLLNLGRSGANQGPTNVTYDQDGVTFLKVGYDARGNAISLSDGAQQIACRSLVSRTPRLLCRVRLFIGNVEKYPPYARYNGYTISYFGAQKQVSPFLDP